MNSGIILILSSGVALGVYIPPLIINNQLRVRGIKTEFHVIENLIREEKICNILRNKFAFHRNFRVALLGQKLSEKSDYGIDEEKVQLLYQQWDKTKISRFLVFSGFWLPIIKNYIKTRSRINMLVDLCHLDSSVSASWEKHDLNNVYFRNIWFFNLYENKVNYYLKISNKPLVEFNKRHERYVIHGGGWGMGTYKEKIEELTGYGLKLDIINYEISDIEKKIDYHRYFMIDPEWKTWEKYDSKNIFPPFAQIQNNDPVEFNYNTEYPEVYDLISNSYGIISKPGGATLLDSLSSSTPVIFLEPFGEYEKDNATLWIRLGFGIYYDNWMSLKCSTNILWRMHKNLQKMLANTQNILDLYV